MSWIVQQIGKSNLLQQGVYFIVSLCIAAFMEVLLYRKSTSTTNFKSVFPPNFQFTLLCKGAEVPPRSS
jgi:hypothetical protein